MYVDCQLNNFEKVYRVYFDEFSISIEDVKTEVIRQMRVSEDRNWEFIAMDPETLEEYKDDDTVRHNTVIHLKRRIIPESQLQERKRKLEWKRREAQLEKQLQELKSAALDRKQIDLTKMEGTEEEKIKKMMEMSTADYAPSKWLKVPVKQIGPVPTSYVCRRCHKPGHWVYQCTFTVNGKPASIKKAKGIPKTMMVEVEGPEVPGAMLTATGKYAVYSGLKEQPSSSPSSATASSPPVPSSSSPSSSPLTLTSSSSDPPSLTPLSIPSSKSPATSSSVPPPSLPLEPSSLSASSPAPSSSSPSQGTTGFSSNSYTPNTSDNAWYNSSSDYQGSGYENSYYGYPVYQPYLGGEPSYPEVDGYPGYNGYNDYQQQTQVVENPLDEFERYLQKKDAEKGNRKHRTKGSRSFEGHRRSPSSSRKRTKYY
ncbi:Similar to RBBP6: E3 ubiquitin-protein ligase RBBP6 (Homo sapiens) [Cotesia congregata]|uniref:Similar to RBBP6: E3 ubiquitin-protein ligase RBBP6 (Homo sapiens) n=1 Tax=Cotesia congregata TaxID=51543 RepID=A0A8J2HML9_COTCN|nr:Similar to RBBP6: E3 ubiquitin-protein ligase RBBP6 (Homo sapiens) [Cotesia congregata]